MKTLKTLPIKYTGELHDIRLINFSLDPKEIADNLPKMIRPRLFEGRALISMVDVKLQKMHPTFPLGIFKFGYRHIAFRLLIEDNMFTINPNKGIYFLKSFTDKAFVAVGGSVFTNYNLKLSVISEEAHAVIFKNEGKYLKYKVDNEIQGLKPEWLKENIQRLDRAYAPVGDTIQYVQIQREKWPIEWIECTEFETDFFETARIEGAFAVSETIYYQWLPPQKIMR